MWTKTFKLVIVCCCMISKQVTTKMAVMPAILATARTNADKTSFSELNSVLVEGPQFCSAICMTNSDCGAFTILDDIAVQNSKQRKYTCVLYEMNELTENATPTAETTNEGITYILHRQQKIEGTKTPDRVTNEIETDKIEKSTSLADNTQSTKDIERRDMETTEKQPDEVAGKSETTVNKDETQEPVTDAFDATHPATQPHGATTRNSKATTKHEGFIDKLNAERNKLN